MRFENGSSYLGDIRVGNRAGSPTWSPVQSSMGAKRFWGQLLFVPNLAKFPFDSQVLEFSFSHPNLNASQLIWEPLRNESSISKLVRLTNWKYSNSSVAVSTRLERYAPGSYSTGLHQVRVEVFVQRTLQGGIQTLLSPSFALIMVFVSFWLPIKESITRISMATAALVSEVFIHVSLRNSALLNLSAYLCPNSSIISLLSNYC